MAAREPFNATARPPVTMTTQRSPWHSPVPYLFGGLAAMLGLIAFALLILACSYWKLSGYLDGSEGGGATGDDRDLEAGAGDGTQKPPAPVYEEKILVIMAGEAKPTFLATPMSSRSSSFGDTSSNSSSCVCSQKGDQKSVEMTELPEKDRPLAGAGENRESSSTTTSTEREHQTH
ncbi:hypothetical protein PanWU01x14_243850 [Parasponia andersonii]|uniref:Protein GLUTAMINE DUMPER n=1 Tax=Parasponia andersonii TaxID=3476 RepID=A0A2P5BFH3_PARAD|nr:hypothetical protein PanWU01x14_243850 [Parasponia andersonii]